MKKGLMICVAGITIGLQTFAGGAGENTAAYTMETPAGWRVDGKIGISKNMKGVYLPVNSTWENATTIMFTNVEQLAPGQSITDVINNDLKNYKSAPSLTINDASPIKTQTGETAVVKHVTGTAFGTTDAVAYIKQGADVIIVVLSTETTEEFTAALPSFEAMVKTLVVNQ